MKSHYVIISALLLSACAAPSQRVTETPAATEDVDIGIRWAEFSAEYQAISAQVYAEARRDLPRLLADPDWTALPGQTDVADKPPAIVLVFDETVVRNAEDQ